MKFSIIILNYRTFELTRDCINSIFLECKNVSFEIIVVDNASGDGSAEKLEKEFGDKILLIKNNKNSGFGAGNNIGAKKAKGEYLFFLNSDTIIRNNILRLAEVYLEKEKNIGILAPKLNIKDGSEQKNAYGDFPTVFSIIFNKFKSDKIEERKIFEKDWVSGAAFFIKKSIFNKVGGFDENIFMYFEDIDLCKRVRDIGFKIVVNKSLFLTHLVSGSSKGRNKKMKEDYYNSQDYFLKKYYGFWSMLVIKIFRFPLKVKLFLGL